MLAVAKDPPAPATAPAPLRRAAVHPCAGRRSGGDAQPVLRPPVLEVRAHLS